MYPSLYFFNFYFQSFCSIFCSNKTLIDNNTGSIDKVLPCVNITLIIITIFWLQLIMAVFLMVYQDSLDPNNPNNVIAIEQTSSKLQRLFVAVNNGIIVFRLKDGQCIYRMPDLHKRSITDILFYQPFQVT